MGIERLERGWPGHFDASFGAEYPAFHRNTLIRRDKHGFIVSTISGGLDRHNRPEPIAGDKMAASEIFAADKDGESACDWQVLPSEKKTTPGPTHALRTLIDGTCSDDVYQRANDMHDALVEWVCLNFDAHVERWKILQTELLDEEDE